VQARFDRPLIAEQSKACQLSVSRGLNSNILSLVGGSSFSSQLLTLMRWESLPADRPCGQLKGLLGIGRQLFQEHKHFSLRVGLSPPDGLGRALLGILPYSFDHPLRGGQPCTHWREEHVTNGAALLLRKTAQEDAGGVRHSMGLDFVC